MPQLMIVTRSGSLPKRAGVLHGYHAELILELIVQRANNNEEECEILYAELEMIELAIADLETEPKVREQPRI